MGRTRMVLGLFLVMGMVFPSIAAAQAENQPPTVSAARNPTGNVRVGVPIQFTATANDPDGDTLSYAWDFGDSTTSTEQNPTKSYLAAATRTATVTVSDGRGGSASASLTIVVQANRAPSANGLVMSPQAGFAPLAVSWTGAATDPDGPSHIVSYAWDLDGDGTDDSTAQNPTFTYTNPGTFSPRVRVSDQFGGSATRTFIVNVLPDAEAAGSRFRILIFSKTAGFRHSSIDEGIAAIKLLGQQNNFHVDAAEESTLFTDAVLAKYDAVVWLSTTSDVLNDAQQAAFERYIQHGGGYAGIHSAADTEYLWPWYGRLVGGYFRNHPNGLPGQQGGRPANVVVEDGAHHSTKHLTNPWNRVDEWYNYQGIVNPVVNGGGVDYSPRNSGVHVLLTLDESSYDEADGSDGVNDDHPISWCHRYDGGRAWYTGMGHTENSFLTDAAFLQHVLGGIEIASGAVRDPTCGVVAVDAPGGVSGEVPATLALTVGAPATFGAFTPGVAREYFASTTATVISTAGSATLSVADPSSTATGHLVNGAFSLPQALQVGAGDPPAPLSETGAGLALKSWSAPVSNEPVTIGFKQVIGSNDALRTGTYSKTLVFTLSTTTP
jgi:cytochrome c